MNNSWWQELMRFFLQGMTFKGLIHMVIILILLVIFTPESFKEWVNLYNPEILPPYCMFYVLLFCGSYVINGFISFAKEKVEIHISHWKKNNRTKKRRLRANLVISNLTEDQNMVLCVALYNREPLVITTQVFPYIDELIKLGVLRPNYSEWKNSALSFPIDEVYWRELMLRWDPANIKIKPNYVG